MTKIIHLAGHSGSGKTLVAVNLALAFAKKGREVVLLDANIYSPDVAYYLGISPSIYFNEFLNGERKIEEVLQVHPSGLKIIPSIAEEHHDEKRNDRINKALLSLIGRAEIVLVDSFCHNPALFSIIDNADETLYVMRDDFPSIAKSKEMIRKMESKGMNVVGVVLNKKIKENNKKHLKAIVEKPILAEIDFEEDIIESVNLGKPALLHYPNSSMAKAARQLADMLDTDENSKQ